MATRVFWLRYALAFALIASLMVGIGGCQKQPVVENLPPANFNGPIQPGPAPVAEAPKAQAKPPVVEKRPSPALAGIPREWTPSGRMNSWRWIVIHHSATPAGGARVFDKMHRAKGWDELGYHFVIGNGTDTSDGQVEVGPRWSKQKHGAHAKTPDNQFNMHGIGICLVGNFDHERPTKAQMASLSRLVAHLMRTHRISSGNILGHTDTGKATECPGRFMDVAQVRRLANQFAGGTGAAQDTPESAPAVQTAAVEMLRDR